MVRVFLRARTGEVAIETEHVNRWRWHVLPTARHRAPSGTDSTCWYDEESRFTAADGWAEFGLVPVTDARPAGPVVGGRALRAWRAAVRRAR